MTAPTTLRAVAELVQLARETPFAELEGSLGRWVKNRFVPGVDVRHFDHVCASLAHTATAKASDVGPAQASEFATFLFPKSVRARFSATGEVTTCRKHVLARLDLAVSNTPYALRLSLSSEEPGTHPAQRLPDLVRLLKRTTFWYRKLFRYDLSHVAEGKSRDEACSSPIRYEVELELDLAATRTQCDTYLAESFLGKLVDLVGRFDAQGRAVRRECRVQRQWTRPRSTGGPC